MRISDIIQKKQRGGELTEEEIRRFVVGFTLGKIPDYQAAALLMAICFQGMTRKETHALCAAMAASGKKVDCSKIEGPTVDKHSTGGVGDKVTLIAAPIAAALGCKVAKMVGRGLDYTGGTGDKLDAVPGCRTALNADMFLNQVNRIGLALIGRTEDLSSADHKLFALRDVTGTAASLPLIASSVMSMKLATGCQNIILDVKLGSGSFMKTPEEAKELASLMVEIGKKAGQNVKAVITDMDAPLGFAVGNNLEVTEAIEVLNGGGPEDLRTVSFTVAALMYAACFNKTQEEAEEAVRKAVADGFALDKLAQMIRLQRGDSNLIYHPDGFPVSKIVRTVSAPQSGFLARMNTEEIGKAARLLGAGREQKDSRIYYSAGIVLHAKPGDYLEKGQSLASFRTEEESRLYEAEKLFLSAMTFSEKPPKSRPLIYEIIS